MFNITVLHFGFKVRARFLENNDKKNQSSFGLNGLIYFYLFLINMTLQGRKNDTKSLGETSALLDSNRAN